MEVLTRANDYMTSIFAMTRPKQEVKQIFDKDGITRLFVRNILGKDNIVKTYYDTPDGFFKNRGIDICTIESKTYNTNQIVVQLEKNIKRIMFLSDMSTKNVKTIKIREDIRKHVDFIEASVYDIFPSGVDVDVRALVPMLKPTIIVTKKRDRYRVFDNKGLKVIISIDDVDYKNLKSRISDKCKQVEMQLDSDKTEAYKDFVYRMSLQVPSLVPMDSNDLINALTRTAFEKRR